MSNRPKKEIPISKCIKTSWSYQNFKLTGHPYWELWNEILHSIQIENKNRLKGVSSVNKVNLVNSPQISKETNSNDNE